jgi:3D (Asp-Asp-Asp) domain-containing protein
MRWVAILALACACAGDIDDGGPGGPDAAVGPDGAAADADPMTADAGPPGGALGSFQLTYYWITDEADYTGVPDTTVYDASCNVLATVAADFWDSMRLEGTARLIDDRVVNYWGSCNCPRSPCFFEVDADHPWGYGSMSRALVPFRSVAVDRDVLAIGESLYAPALDGLLVPGEPPWGDFIHDGCLTADDTGGGITGMHIDFFVALRSAYLDINGELGLSDVELYQGGDRCPAP